MHCTLHTSQGKYFCDLAVPPDHHGDDVLSHVTSQMFQVYTDHALKQGDSPILMMDEIEYHLPVKVERCEAEGTWYRVLLRPEGKPSRGLVS
ncbi:MAG: hypothetical protein OEV94_01265 [Deltaproteobacteria bacterium]|nr:hypothetical protein [Deltaproteobacteria bacterium]